MRLEDRTGAHVVMTWPAVPEDHPDHELIDLCAEWRRAEEEALRLSIITDLCYSVALERYPEKPVQIVRKMKMPGDIEARDYLMTEEYIQQLAGSEARRAELLAVLGEHQAALKAIGDECGYLAAKQESDAANEKGRAIEGRIQGTLAVTGDGVLAKLLITAVVWHPDNGPEEPDTTDMKMLVSSVRDTAHLAADLAPPAPSSVQHPDAELIVLGRRLLEIHRFLDTLTDDTPDTDAEIDDGNQRYEDIVTAINAIPAQTWEGLRIKLRIATDDVDPESDDSRHRALYSARDDAERVVNRGGGGVAVTALPVAAPSDDDALFAKLREVEALKAKSRDLGNGPESEAVLDQALDTENELANIPAHTPAGAAAKLGVALHYRADCNDMTDKLVASAQADLDRQAGAATDVAAAVSALAPPASQLVDDPDFGPVTSEIVGLGREAREHTFKLAKLAILADQYERGGPAEPFIEACAEYAETDRWGAFRVMQLMPAQGGGSVGGAAS